MILYQDIVLPTAYAFPTAAARLLVLSMSPLPGGHTQIIYLNEGGRPPPVSDYLTATSGIPAAAEEKFDLVFITIVSNG